MANEVESNNSQSEANEIVFNETVTGNISEPGEQDYFKINVSSPGTINISFDVPTNSSENDYFAIGITRGQELLAKYYIGSDTNISIPAQYSGTYYIWFDNRYDANATKGSGLTLHDAGQYSFVATFSDTLGNVELENNSRADNATPIIKNTEYTGQINRVGDGDFYKISVDNPGDLELVFTPSSTTNTEDFSVEIITGDGSQALQVVKTGSTAILTQAISSAGDYLVRVNSGNQTINDDPYTIKIVTTETSNSGEIEPNNSINEATLLTNSTLTGQLNNDNDTDYYEFTINQPGKININFDPPTNTSSKYFNLSIRDSNGSILASYQTGKSETLSAYVESSGKYYVLVQKDTFFNSENYTIEATFSSGSFNYETESGANNNSIGSYSDNIVLGKTYTAQLHSNDDVDTFSFTIDQPGTIDLTFLTPSDTSSKYYDIEILDSSSNLLSGTEIGQDTTVSASAQTSGTYYVRIKSDTFYKDDSYDIKVTTTAGLGDVELEPNNSINGATLLTNSTLIGQLNNDNDLDYYKIEANQSGTITLTFDPTTDTSSKYFNVTLKKSSGEILSGIETGRAETFSATVGPGTYYALVQKDTFFNSENYTVKRIFSPNSGDAAGSGREVEINNTQNTATSIPLDTFITAQLYNREDADTFSFTIDQPGTIDLTFRTSSSTSSKYYDIEIRDPSYNLLSGTEIGQDTTVSASAQTSGTYYVRIKSDTFYKDDSYDIKVTTTAGLGDVELEPNNSISDGTLLEDTALTGNLANDNDLDYYKIEANQSGTITLTFDPTTDTTVSYTHLTLPTKSIV